MIGLLNHAAILSADPPDAPHIETTHTVHTGQPGRPRIQINADILGAALEMQGPTGLAPVSGVSARTV